MGENSLIEWTTHTFNPWIGCQKVSPGCDHCYAEHLMDHRLGRVQWGPHGERKRTSEANWRKPVQWAKAAIGAAERPRVFCASLADVFDNQVREEWRDDLWEMIARTPSLDWLLLTKRPENIAKMLPVTDSKMPGYKPWNAAWPWPNVWLGTTCEDQERYDRRWPILRAVPAAIRFISYEPAIGSLRLPYVRGTDSYHDRSAHPNWIICGGESVQGKQEARHMGVNWAQDIQRDCKDRGIAFFMKQMSNGAPIPDYLMVRQFPR